MSGQCDESNIFILTVCLLLHLSACKGFDIDHWGTHFVLSFLKNYNSEPNFNYVIVTARELSNVTVTFHEINQTTELTIAAGESESVSYGAIASAMPYLEVLPRKGISVEASAKVSVYGFTDGPRTHDGYLALPVPSLGTKYLAVNMDPGWPQIVVVGVEDGTTINIKLPSLNYCYLSASSRLFRVETNYTFVYTLNAHDAVNIICNKDTSGSIIKSDKPVAVLSGNLCASLPPTSFCDHMVEMLPPTSELGTTFVIAAPIGQDYPAMLRVVALNNGTTLNINSQSFSLDSSEHKTVQLSDADKVCVSSNEPVLVAMYMTGRNTSSATNYMGDAAMMIIPPTDRYAKHYILNVAMSTSNSHHAVIFSDKATSSYIEPQITSFDDICDMAFHILSVSDIVDYKSRFSFFLLSYGFGRLEGYGYPGGMTLTDFSGLEECASRPCQNNGWCLEVGMSYRCRCLPGYAGDNCEIELTTTGTVVSTQQGGNTIAEQDQTKTQQDAITTQQDETTTQRDEINTQLDEITTHHSEITIPQAEVATPQNKITTQQHETTTQQDEITTKLDEITTLQAEITTLQAEIATPQAEIATPQAEITTQQDEMTTLQAEIATPQAEIATPQAEITTQQDEITTLWNETTTQWDEITTQEDVITTQTEITTLQAEIATPQAEIATPQAEITTQQDEMTTLQAEIATPQAEITTQQDEITTLWNETTTQRDEITTQEDVITTQTEITTLQAEIATPQAEIAKPQAEITTQQDEMTTLQAEIATPQAEITTQQDEITTLWNETTTQWDEITTQEDVITTQQAEITTQQDAISTIHVDLTTPQQGETTKAQPGVTVVVHQPITNKSHVFKPIGLRPHCLGANCQCPCPCRKLKRVLIDGISFSEKNQMELKIDKNIMSKNVRLKRTADNLKASESTLGAFSFCLVAILCSLIVLLDLPISRIRTCFVSTFSESNNEEHDYPVIRMRKIYTSET